MKPPQPEPGGNGAATATAAPSEFVIEADGLVKSVGVLSILRGISFRVRRSELTVLIGPSGSGKSTVLRCLNGLETFNSGSLRIGSTALGPLNGHPAARDAALREIRKSTGMVFQQFNLFPHLNVLQNVTLAPRVVKGAAPAACEEKGMNLLAKVGLSDRSRHYPSQLSGGQQQRVAIARALAMDPDVLLYDEPTSALDPTLVDEVLNVMRTLREEGMTQVVVTHEMRFARDAADQALFLHGGVIAEAASGRELFARPRDPRTREFLKKFLN